LKYIREKALFSTNQSAFGLNCLVQMESKIKTHRFHFQMSKLLAIVIVLCAQQVDQTFQGKFINDQTVFSIEGIQLIQKINANLIHCLRLKTNNRIQTAKHW
jgi:hypothetical protein